MEHGLLPYQLREAAGAYWLLDMEQDGKEYRPALQLNETGARIVCGLAAGKTAEQLAAELAAYYEIPEKLLREDVNSFIGQLGEQDILTGLQEKGVKEGSENRLWRYY